MPIDPYEPELAKRKTILAIADRQLKQAMSAFSNLNKVNSQEKLNGVLMALKDYQDAAKGVSQWVQQNPKK
ncbi:hypothetical protein Lepto7375DRAFT_5019 [Leptolyngbya sp. PCC 7375]|nr:hypothetical protein Lepto7375DRAFT_5019 [Leptolyngbya sp. PCC 7375]